MIQANKTHNQQESICIETEVNTIIHEEQQMIVFDILEECKYAMILKLS